jgi:hypothetical protein
VTHYKETRYGFEYGPMEVERACSDDKWGVVITLKTPKEHITIRSTPTGLIRVGKLVKLVKEHKL